jgi:hypothetical protein
MSSFFDEASLVMIPSGYKDQKVYSVKPLDGSGDLTFSRASSATRVASNGLIEKVRTNLVLQSQTFDNASWTSLAVSVSVTENVIVDPFGGNDADIIVADAITSNIIYVRQAITLPSTGTYTYSVYVKKQNQDTVGLRSLASGLLINYDLVNETSSNPAGFIEDAGNGWFRIGLTYTSGTTSEIIFIYPLGTGTRTGNGVDGVYVFGAQLEVSDFGATDYIATTTTAVSVGPVSGLPRLDYLNSSCPRLLLEPQRSNLALFSENFDNAYWSKTAGTTITANTTISPDGYQNADTIAFAGSGDSINRFITTGLSVVSGTTYTFSVFTKSTTQVVSFGGATGGTGTNVYNGAVDYGNGWYRQSVTRTWSASGTVSVQLVLTLGAAGSTILYGFQAELGAYASSYLNTLSTSVTRVADAASKTGISSLIGQTEGTLFAELDFSAIGESRRVLCISDNSTNNRILIALQSTNTIRAVVSTAGVLQLVLDSSPVTSGIYKIAFAYAANNFALYVNGTQVASTLTGSVPSCSAVFLGKQEDATNDLFLNDRIAQALLFKTRLTNAQLAELTA